MIECSDSQRLDGKKTLYIVATGRGTQDRTREEASQYAYGCHRGSFDVHAGELKPEKKVKKR